MMILTTTNSVEGFRIAEYNGIVSGIAISIQKTRMSFSMQKVYAAISVGISELKEQAFKQLEDNANKLNANAIIGIHVDIEFQTNGHITVSVTGTAVSIIKK